jgi:hypothetical protein
MSLYDAQLHFSIYENVAGDAISGSFWLLAVGYLLKTG